MSETTAAPVPPVEKQIAIDAARRGLPVVAVLVVAAALVGDVSAGLSVAYGSGLALVNLLVAAASLGWAARISAPMLMGVALFGYLVRLGLITIAVLVVAGAAWVNVVALGLALVLTHLGLLVWEARYVSVALAHPGLKPRKENA